MPSIRTLHNNYDPVHNIPVVVIEDVFDEILVNKILQCLDNSERKIVEKIVLEGHTVASIANELGINYGMAKRRYNSGIRNLKNRLGGAYGIA